MQPRLVMGKSLIKEVCSHCLGFINVGQPISECQKCTILVHTKCYKVSKFSKVNNKDYCVVCSCSIKTRYNPYKFVECIDNNDKEVCDEGYSEMRKVSSVLESCRSYNVSSLNAIDETMFVNNISMYFLNVDGNRSNFDELIVELNQYKHSFSIIGIAETNVDCSVSEGYQIPGYYSFYQNIKSGKSKGSGVALYIKNCLTATLNTNLSQISDNLETLFVSISHENRPLNIGVAYRPPSGKSSEAIRELGNIMKNCPTKRVYCMGDYNIDLHEKQNSLLSEFEEEITTSGFYPSISLPTHHKVNCRETCIDNILTNDIDTVQLCGTISDRISHHLPIFAVLDINMSQFQDVKHVQFYDYCNSNIDNFVYDLATSSNNNTIEDFTSFNKLFHDTLDRNCKLDRPKTSKRTPLNNPWITPGLCISSARKHELRKEFRKSKCKRLPGGDPVLEKKFKDFQRNLKHTIKLAKSSYYCTQITNKTGDRKKMWELINELRGKSRRQIKPQFIIDNVKINNSRVIANEFNKYFVSIATKMNNDCVASQVNSDCFGFVNIIKLPDFTTYLPSSCMSSIFLHDCNAEEIRIIISELQNGKSSDIPIKVIKQSSSIICPILEKLYNKCMHDGFFPDELKVGRISPIYKKDSEEKLENYRPVSTLAVFGKIFEKIIYSRMYSYFISQGHINENQFGFRKGHSTSHALNYSISHIEEARRNKKHVLGIFIDLSKAFDTIDHSTLIHKLRNYGVRGNALDLISSYLTDRKQFTHVLGEDSDKLTIRYGVPQGSVLGPLLFLIYINDICNTSKMCKFVLFADDTNIFVMADSKADAYKKANTVLKLVYNYMLCNKLHINLKKCCYMYFSPYERDNTEDHQCIHLNDHEIDRVSEVRFLGVLIDDKLNWKPHIKNLLTKLRSCTGQICRFKDNIPQELRKDIYHTLFESHLTFGISVWGGLSMSRFQPLFVTQKKCIRILFGDSERYKDKFRTCARARPFGNQVLGSEFYQLEASKPLLNKNDMLTVHNLYQYHSVLEIYKIMKLRVPISLYSLAGVSARKETLLVSKPKSSNFLCMATKLWNEVRQRLSIYDFSTSIGSLKSKLKICLLRRQKGTDNDVWCDNDYLIGFPPCANNNIYQFEK